MADTTISGNSTTAQTITGGNRLIVTDTGELRPAGPAIVFNLATPGLEEVVNDGIIAPTSGRAFDATGTATGAVSLSIVNGEGAQIIGVSDVMRVQRTLAGGSLSIENAGTITANAGRGVNVQDYVGLARFDFANAAGATFQSTDDGLRLTAAANATFTGVIAITNAGTLRSVGAGSGQAIDLNDVNATAAGQVTVTNLAGGVIESGDADAIRGSRFIDIQNFGTIRANNAAATSTGNDAIDFQANGGGSISNHAGAAITGARHGVTGDVAVTITNDGAITGLNGAGINLDSPTDSVATIVNGATGVITGTLVGIADGDGIDVDGLIDLTNSGTIRALGTATGEGAPLNEAMSIGGGTIVNEAGGTIVSDGRAITVDDSDLGAAFGATTITNRGTITGANGEAIRITGTFGDTIVNDGVIVGSVVTGDGDDVIRNAGSISGLIDAGAGNDRLEGGSGNELLAGGAGADMFLFAAAATGTDRIIDMGADDVLVTTTALVDSNDDARITFGGNRLLDLGGGGTLRVDSDVGRRVSALEFDGSFVADDVQYFVYSLVGSTAGVATAAGFLGSNLDA